MCSIWFMLGFIFEIVKINHLYFKNFFFFIEMHLTFHLLLRMGMFQYHQMFVISSHHHYLMRSY